MTGEALRPAQPEDAAEIARLAGELGYEATAGQMRSRLKRLCADATQFVMVAPADATQLRGWIHAGRRLALESGEAVEILGLVVDSAARRQSLGRSLVLAAEQWACACGVTRIVVRSNAARAQSHAFYPALGYELAKTQRVYRRSLGKLARVRNRDSRR